MSSQNSPGVGIGIMILKDNKVLLGRRHEDPEKADSLLHGEGTWTMPGGKLHFGESFEDAAYREVLEETGIKINKEKLRVISVTNDIVEDAHFVTIGLLCEDFEGEPKVMEPDEIVEWKWFSFDELPSPIYFPSEKILKNYLDGEFYKH
jgi:8-oxo-dGTP diphosphatase